VMAYREVICAFCSLVMLCHAPSIRFPCIQASGYSKGAETLASLWTHPIDTHFLVYTCRWRVWNVPAPARNRISTFRANRLTQRSRALIEKLPVAQLLKNLPTIYANRMFITVHTRSLHWILLWARTIQSIPPHPICVRSIWMLF
jgi:hypothetical protein